MKKSSGEWAITIQHRISLKSKFPPLWRKAERASDAAQSSNSNRPFHRERLLAHAADDELSEEDA